MNWTRSDRLRLFHIIEGAYHRGLSLRQARELMEGIGIEWISHVDEESLAGRGLEGGSEDDFRSSYGEPLFCYEEGDSIMMHDPAGIMRIDKDLARKILIFGLY